jgi:hypothetical protein
MLTWPRTNGSEVGAVGQFPSAQGSVSGNPSRFPSIRLKNTTLTLHLLPPRLNHPASSVVI